MEQQAFSIDLALIVIGFAMFLYAGYVLAQLDEENNMASLHKLKQWLEASRLAYEQERIEGITNMESCDNICRKCQKCGETEV